MKIKFLHDYQEISAGMTKKIHKGLSNETKLYFLSGHQLISVDRVDEKRLFVFIPKKKKQTRTKKIIALKELASNYEDAIENGYCQNDSKYDGERPDEIALKIIYLINEL